MRDCAKRIAAKSGGKVSYDDAKELLKSVGTLARKKVNAGVDYDDAVKSVLAERTEVAVSNLFRQQANIARNAVIKQRRVDKIAQFMDAGLSIKDAFIADLEGISSPIAGTADSLDVQKNAVKAAYMSRYISELNKEGLLPLLNSKTLDKEIGRELWALSNGEKGATKNKQAARIAEIIHGIREDQRLRLNGAGADISELGGYIMPQRHDVPEMLKAKENEWVAFMAERIDETRTFGGDVADMDAALRGAYQALVTGIRLNDPTPNGKDFQFYGPANLGKRLSQARQIHFKSFDAWQEWNSKFGSKDLNEGVQDAISFDADNIALLERYGTNPEAMMQAVAQNIKERYRDRIAANGEQGVDAKIQSVINAAMEKNLIAAHPKLATIGSNIRVFNNITSLGGALISSISDMPLKSLEYQFQGNSWLSSMAQPFKDMSMMFKGKKERTEWASMVGVGFESLIADIGGRFSAQDSLGNKAAKVQRMFFKLNGLAGWTDGHRAAMGRMMAHGLGLKKGVEFEALDADTKRLFGNYNITKADWDAMRKAVVTLDDGRDYILPDAIKSQRIKEKLIGYFADRTSFGVIEPNARIRRITTAGTQRGTPEGEAIRLLMQFKSFPIAVITKVWGRTLYGKGKADVPAMAYLMLMSMAFGYMAGAAKDMLKNKTPKDPRKLETVYAALAQGGGMGILGDLLLQDGSGFGRSLADVAAGPTVGKLSDAFKIYSAGVRGGGSARQATMTGIGLIPFNNLFYTRAALDHILLLEMQESMNPGYLRRMEQNMKKTYGQELIFQ